MRKLLTDAGLAKVTSGTGGARKPYNICDTRTHGLIVRVGKSSSSFMLRAVFPTSRRPIRRLIGKVGKMTVERAREIALEWHKSLRVNEDPKHVLAAIRHQAAVRQAYTFDKVAQEFIERHVSQLRRKREYTRLVRKELMPVWGTRPIADISRDDLVHAIVGIADRGAQRVAHNTFSVARSLFSWAVQMGTFGLRFSPVEQPPRIRLAKVIGPKRSRDRLLGPEEARAYWLAADEMGYPNGHFLKVLLLTAQRRDEVAHMRWPELSLDQGMWTLPGERQKSGRETIVPLAKATVAVLRDCPVRKSGDYVFSTCFGKKPIAGFGHMKSRRLNGLMRQHLGLGPKDDEIPNWCLHDTRRYCRSTMAELGVAFEVAELCIGHKLRGLAGVYMRAHLLEERRQAFEKYSQHIISSVLCGAAPHQS